MKFTFLDESGHTVKEYDMSAKKEARLAAKQFNKALNEGGMLIGTDKEGNKFMAGEFDPQAVEYVVGKRLVGG